MAATNFLSADLGASVVRASSDSEQVASAASNVLVDREDQLWICQREPHELVLSLPSHPPIRFIGWYVWHDYLTNPHTVDIEAGTTESDLHLVTTCTALPGAGVQLWSLEEPLDECVRFLRFRVTSTFGGAFTYLNRVYAFAEHPGASFVAAGRQVANAPVSPGRDFAAEMGSPLHMSSLLRELDDDIRSLHPLRTATPVPISVSRSGNPSAVASEERHRQPSLPPQATSDVTAQRLATLEASVVGLVRAVEQQSRDIATLQRSIVEARPHAPPSTTRPASTLDAKDFPEEALRRYVEDVMAPKLSKHTRRFEARVMQRMDDHLQELLRAVTTEVDDRVAHHMRHVALSVDESYRGLAHPPSTVRKTSRR